MVNLISKLYMHPIPLKNLSQVGSQIFPETFLSYPNKATYEQTTLSKTP
jgi:hypothetical protein